MREVKEHPVHLPAHLPPHRTQLSSVDAVPHAPARGLDRGDRGRHVRVLFLEVGAGLEHRRGDVGAAVALDQRAREAQVGLADEEDLVARREGDGGFGVLELDVLLLFFLRLGGFGDTGGSSLVASLALRPFGMGGEFLPFVLPHICSLLVIPLILPALLLKNVV